MKVYGAGTEQGMTAGARVGRLGAAAMAVCVLATSAMAGDLLRQYFPLVNSDQKTYVADINNSMHETATMTYTTFNSSSCFAWRLVDNSGDVGTWYVNYLGDDLVAYGASQGGYTMTFSPPLVLLDEDTLSNNGSATHTSTVHVGGSSGTIQNTHRVAAGGTVTVPYGTFANCKQLWIDMTVSGAGGTARLTAMALVLAPDIGYIKEAIVDESFQPVAWYLLEQWNGARCWWQGSTALGGGWRWQSWFGFFNAQSTPWIYHMQHGWMYSLATTTDSIWFYTPDLGWLWTSSTMYPWLCSGSRGSWIYYLRDSASPRWFMIANTGQWEACY